MTYGNTNINYSNCLITEKGHEIILLNHENIPDFTDMPMCKLLFFINLKILSFISTYINIFTLSVNNYVTYRFDYSRFKTVFFLH